jgi:hypothetical protein
MLGENTERAAFGGWLLAQHKRDDFIGALAKGLKNDRAFPKAGSVEDVRKHLSTIRAEGDAFEALDDAEGAWLSS